MPAGLLPRASVQCRRRWTSDPPYLTGFLAFSTRAASAGGYGFGSSPASGRVVQVLVVRHGAAFPVGGGAQGVAAVALVLHQQAAQRGHGAGFARAPGVALAGGQREGAHGVDQRRVVVQPVQLQARLRGQRAAVGGVQRDEGEGMAAGGQLLQPPGDGGQRRHVAGEQVPGVVGGYEEGAARAADVEPVARLGTGGPGGGRAVAVQSEFQRQLVGHGVVAARGVVAPRGASTPGGQEQLDVVVEPGAVKAFQRVATQGDDAHLRADLGGAAHFQGAHAQFVAHALDAAGGGGKVFGHGCGQLVDNVIHYGK